MNLDSTNKLLQIVLGEAATTNNCDIVSSFADSSVTSFSLGNTNVHSNGVTPVTVVGSPGASVQRQVKEIRLFNNDTVPHTVTLQLFDGANTWIIAPSLLTVPVNGDFVYTPESGVCCTSGGGGGSSLTVQDDTGDTVTSTGTLEFVGVKVSGSTPSAIVNMATIAPIAATGGASGTYVTATGGNAGPSGTYGGNVILTGGLPGASASPGYGGAVRLVGGAGGAGTVVTQGGGVYGQGGAGGGGTASTGGHVRFDAGNGDPASPNGYGGGVVLGAGIGYGAGTGGNSGFYAGAATGSGNGGSVYARGGSSAVGVGGNVALSTGSGSPPGQVSVNSDSSLIVAGYSWVAGALLDNQTIFTTTRAMVITAVIGRPDVVNGSAATLTIVKAASGTAPSGGTPLTSTSMDLTAAVDTNQTLTLSGTLADITLAPGDSLCMVTTGIIAASAGCITVWGTPQ